MRKLLLGGLFLIMGVAGASAQPYWGGGYGYYGPRPGYGFYGPRPGYGYGGPRYGYGGGYYGPRRRCWIRPGFYGPVRVCRW